MSYTVSPDLYSLWRLTSRVTHGLFADVISESECLSSFCGRDRGDAVFGGLSAWGSLVSGVSGGAANPPYERGLRSKVLAAFQERVLRPEPYCRCVILPRVSRYGMMAALCSATSVGHILASMPGDTMPFKHRSELLAMDC